MSRCFPQFDSQDPAINMLRHKVRYAEESDNPGLIPIWLSMEEAGMGGSKEEAWLLYMAEYRLLLDTLSDDMLEGHWRIWCLDNIYKPLSALTRLVDTDVQQQQLNHLFYELRVTSQFFKAGLTA
ncbi:hypothetical protein [Shewanella sp. UCD-KL12]|uniref:hypothetical protein n=1 Tax=Shewanella sp. UCD-KL12 TaxID=1917163 RepID=UPI00097087CE|nr:hypothetical protein [Shewanella sp. UCD-KL12]